MKKYCYCTILTSNDFFYGVISIYSQLKLFNCEYPFVVIVTENVSKVFITILKTLDILVYEKPLLSFNRENNRHNYTLNTIYALNLTDYDKLLYLEPDIIIKKNFDNIFNDEQLELPVFMAVEDYYLTGGFYLIVPTNFDYLDYIKNVHSFVSDEELFNHFYKPNLNNKKILNQNYPFSHVGEKYPNKYWKDFDIEKLIKFLIKFYLDRGVTL